MLSELRVSHFAIIQNLKVSFRPGLNILSGETGAGKSVLLKSLGLLMGDKATTDLVSDRAESASVEGLFDLRGRPDVVERLKSLDVPVLDDELIVRRVLSREGSSRVYLNGSLSTLQVLREIVFPLVEVTRPSAPLIEMTGQHESKNLMSKHYHLEVLDMFCESSSLRLAYEEIYKKLLELRTQIRELEESSEERDQRLDYLKYQYDQITNLNLKPKEDELIVEELKVLKSSAKLQSLAQTADQVLIQDEGSAQSRLHSVAHLCADLAKTNARGTQWADQLRLIAEQLEEVVFQIQNFTHSTDLDPAKISHLEERLSDIRTLQKRYGPSVEDLLAHVGHLQGEIERLSSLEEMLKVARRDQAKLELALKAAGEKLSAVRKKGARVLEAAVNEELAGLNMKGVTVLVTVEPLTEATASGYDSVELQLKSSAKATPKPLRKVASGGELSRVLLALKCASGDQDTPRTYLFDEVDTGVSGETAQKVGRKLQSIAKDQQVVCITHLPQVAAFADHHFYIKKTLKDGLAAMVVKSLDGEERVREIARLLSGESVTTTAMKNARELVAGTSGGLTSLQAN